MDINTCLTALIAFYNDPLQKVQALIKIIETYGYDPTIRSVVNNSSDYALIRQLSLVQIGSVIPDITFTSSTDAETLKDQLSYIFSAELDEITDYQVFDYMTKLRTAIQTELTKTGYALPELVTYTAKTNLPSCLIAQNIYQDGTRSDEIIQRNNANVVHPMFMPTTLIVLAS